MSLNRLSSFVFDIIDMLSRGNNRPVRLEDWEEAQAHRGDCGDHSFVFKACRQSSTSRQPYRHKEHF